MSYRRVVHATVLLYVLLFAVPLAAQGATTAPAAPTSAQSSAPIAVFLDCRTDCDDMFFRTEITYVNWVRDRQAADVHVLITEQDGGAGGEQLTLAFIGLRGLVGRSDTLTFDTNPTTTDDERRRGVARTIALGLMQFVARSSTAQLLRISAAAVSIDARPQQTRPKNDPWNAWVFEVGLNGSLDGERAYAGRDLEMQFESRRVTDAMKTNFEYSFSYRDNRATVQETDSVGVVVSEETYRNLQREWRGELLQVHSINNHWSAGGQLEFASQTFRNQNLRVEGGLALEYNIFPYAEATRRELSFRYGVGAVTYRYADSTVFDKIRETLPIHFVEASYRTRQQWGSANINLEHRNFLNDPSKRNSSINGSLSVRIFKGFNVNAGGGYEWIRDQVYLPKGERDAIDVLLRRRALLTGFQYFSHFGISYTFGSIYNNVVNPRF